jgi:hypothetical protein
MRASSFRIEVPDQVLDDLRSRLRRTRFTARSGERPWLAGADPDYLGDLVTLSGSKILIRVMPHCACTHE